jgi:hypothetical protein
LCAIVAVSTFALVGPELEAGAGAGHEQALDGVVMMRDVDAGAARRPDRHGAGLERADADRRVRAAVAHRVETAGVGAGEDQQRVAGLHALERAEERAPRGARILRVDVAARVVARRPHVERPPAGRRDQRPLELDVAAPVAGRRVVPHLVVDAVADVDAEVGVVAHDVVVDDAAVARVAEAVAAVVVDGVEQRASPLRVLELDAVAAVAVHGVVARDDAVHGAIAAVVRAQADSDGAAGHDEPLDHVVVVAHEESRAAGRRAYRDRARRGGPDRHRRGAEAVALGLDALGVRAGGDDDRVAVQHHALVGHADEAAAADGLLDRAPRRRRVHGLGCRPAVVASRPVDVIRRTRERRAVAERQGRGRREQGDHE